jgi:hypothetical protein
LILIRLRETPRKGRRQTRLPRSLYRGRDSHEIDLQEIKPALLAVVEAIVDPINELLVVAA